MAPRRRCAAKSNALLVGESMEWASPAPANPHACRIPRQRRWRNAPYMRRQAAPSGRASLIAAVRGDGRARAGAADAAGAAPPPQGHPGAPPGHAHPVPLQGEPRRRRGRRREEGQVPRDRRCVFIRRIDRQGAMAYQLVDSNSEMRVTGRITLTISPAPPFDPKPHCNF